MTRYLEIDMPAHFVLECLTDTGAWIDHGLYRAQDFGRTDDGTYCCWPAAGSRLYMRCLRQDGCVIYVVDGANHPYTYRLVPFPSKRYWPSARRRLERLTLT